MSKEYFFKLHELLHNKLASEHWRATPPVIMLMVTLKILSGGSFQRENEEKFGLA